MRPQGSRAAFAFKRVRSNLHKITWGIRTVGPGKGILGAARLVCLRIRRPDTFRLVLTSGPVFELDYPRQLIPALVVFGDYIDPEYALLKLIARPEWVVFDVGAAVGQFSIFAARLPVKVIHAFEPSSDNIATLARNANINHVDDRIEIHQRALADRRTEGSFATGNNPFMSQLGSVDNTTRTETVVVGTLAEEARRRGFDHIDCLKVNVAGFEPEVLRGGMEYLAQEGVSVLIILIGERCIELYSEIARLGYRFFFFHPPTKALHALPSLDMRALANPPWPARHVIGIRDSALSSVLRDVTIATDMGR